ncbi:M28 family peptidase [Streptomyces armeniacus]|uniref:M28 family peptidase n=1 Tax=Streptomyces armeniacus TaxID=83291 RepID=UPI001FEA7E65|nr:M28 family peptidase [Streptomyces armeniacus]
MKRRLLPALAALLLALLGVSTASADTAVAPASATARQAPPQIPAENVMAHLDEFQKIADANGDTRAHGTPGYEASADYVQSVLDAAGFETERQAFTYNGRTGWNVIAEWPHGDTENVVMAGAHLDSVTRGPGLNDNGSGSAAVLEVALAVSRADLRPEQRLRFGWWGAEENGLIGSDHYAGELGQSGRAKLDAYLNFDMVGQKALTDMGVYTHDAAISGMFEAYYEAQGIPTYGIRWDGSSDHSSFAQYGVTVGGIGSGDDPCYHSPCDTVSNVGADVVGHSANAIAHTVWQLGGA